MSSQLFPEVIDKSGLGAKYSQPLIMPMAVEGQADNAGSASVGTIYTIAKPADSDTYFGPASTLGLLVKFILNRGVTPVYAIASAKGVAPTLLQRQTAWAILEQKPDVRIRMTDDTLQATLVALAGSCDNAALINNKQIAFGGLAAGSTKSALLAAAVAINSKRFVLVGPGILDSNGVLYSGNFASAVVATEVAKNPDITDTLNLYLLPNLSGIELAPSGMPVFMEKVVAGSAVNDFEDLLQSGVSPLMTDRAGAGVRATHLRMTYTGATPGSPPVDTTFDALRTRLVVDQIFIDVRDYVINNNFLRKGNTVSTRAAIQAGVADLLNNRSDWISPITQADGSPGHAVSVIPSPDLRQITIQYQGVVIRGLNTVQVDAQLTIPV